MRKLVPALLCLLVAPAVLAQGRAGSVEITPLAGYWFGDTFARGAIRGVDFDITVDDAPAYGVRVGYKFTPSWALDLLLARSSADLVTGRRELFGGAEKVGTLDSTAGEIGVEGAFGHSRFVPFIGGGIGLMHLNPHINGLTLSADDRFVGHFGAGFKVFFTPDVALRLDWRIHSVNVESGGHTGCSFWDECRHDLRWLNFNEVALGLTFAI